MLHKWPFKISYVVNRVYTAVKRYFLYGNIIEWVLLWVSDQDSIPFGLQFPTRGGLTFRFKHIQIYQNIG